MTSNKRHSSSFRDPSGYVFVENGILKRTIKPIYFKQFNSLNESGFYSELFEKKLLVKHSIEHSDDSEIIIVPDQIPFFTYPYEWSFLQFKEAALLTLKIQKYALEHGYTLKDASAFNITFHKSQAVFVDTLSFDFYIDNTPWRAYKQFVSHFLGPLLLAHYHGAQSLKLMGTFIDGIPMSMLASMLPFKSKLNPFLFSNVHLLAKFEAKHHADYKGKQKHTALSKKAQLNIIKSLYDFIKRLKLKEETEWGDYYTKTNYTDAAFSHKSEIINNWVKAIKPLTLIDIGGNDGKFVRQIKYNFKHALVCDVDNNAVDSNYRMVKLNQESYMQPFVLDVLNPTADIGFNNKERYSFLSRIQDYKPDVTMALAVIHHMTLTGNIPFEMSARFFSSFSSHLIIEFPTSQDSWVERLLNVKGEFRDHFNFYSLDNFKNSYLKFFELVEQVTIQNSNRVMFLFRNKNA